MLQNFEDLENASTPAAAFWLFIGEDLMISLISRENRRPFWAQTVLMLVILVVVLGILRVFTSHHYFMGAVSVCYGFVIGWFAGWTAKRTQAPGQA